MLPFYQMIMNELDDDEERREEVLQLNIQRRIRRNDNDPFTISDIMFKDLFRLTKDMVHYLEEQVMPHMTISHHPSAIEPRLRIFAALFFYANGSYQRVLGESHVLSMGQTTVGKCIREVTNLIVEHLADLWIQFPTTRAEKLQIKAAFMERYGFPGVIGAIDCTHVAMIAPKEEEHNYLNRKGYHSKNVQLICDANLRILNVNARYAGATHDAYIWRRSAIRQELLNRYFRGDQNSWLLGDSGYPQEPWLMTPVINAAPESPEERYNTSHVSARNTIERCNGILKNRFRCIMGERTLRYEPELVGNIVVACCVLHNICLGGLDVPRENGDQDIANIEDEIEINEGREARRLLIEIFSLNKNLL